MDLQEAFDVMSAQLIAIKWQIAVLHADLVNRNILPSSSVAHFNDARALNIARALIGDLQVDDDRGEMILEKVKVAVQALRNLSTDLERRRPAEQAEGDE